MAWTACLKAGQTTEQQGHLMQEVVEISSAGTEQTYIGFQNSLT